MSVSSDPIFELAYFPYIGLRGVQEIRFGRASVWNSNLLSARVSDPPLRGKIEALLQMNRSTAHQTRDSRPLTNIGIITIDSINFDPLDEDKARQTRELRYALFLCALAHNARLNGPNAGHSSYTSENFDLVRQTFVLNGDSFAETSGAIIRFRIMGYKVSETSFPRPPYVPEPTTFIHDDTLLAQLTWLRNRNRRLYRRIMRAAALFLESYYNTPSVDLGARILLQAAAFEVLLDLPDNEQRKVFKNIVEDLAINEGDRRYRYKFEARNLRLPETRSQKGIWADRFYTLRNHIIHGEFVPQSEYMFRHSQHHLLIASLFFVFLTKRMIDRSRLERGLKRAFYERIDWTRLQDADEFEPERNGFKLSTDFAAMYGLR